MMDEYKDEPFPRDSSSTDDVEMQERDDEYESEENRLLNGPSTDRAAVEYKVEWHLRTGWAIVLSVLLAGLVFVGMLAYTRFLIVSDHSVDIQEQEVHGGIGGFRRPASDYILTPKWNSNAKPQVRTYQWTISDIIANPDGVFRPLMAINGQFPGPLIECNEGDTLVIDVENKATNATSIHFHGMFQNGTNFMDGTSGVTQCPIAPNKKFRYEFTVKRQSGTYYYHGHQAVQISDGLYGPVVVHSKDEKTLQHIQYASDRVVMLQDYYHDLSSGLLKSFLEPGNEDSPIPDGALINGLNKRDCSRSPNRMCDNSTALLPGMDLKANENHRLRFINVGAFAWFQVSVDEHDFAITEVDGTDIVPSRDTRLMIAPSQRYSMIVSADHPDTSAFWLRAKMVTHCWKHPQLPGAGLDEVKAVLTYTTTQRRSKSVVSQPETRAWAQGMEVQCRDMNTTSYIPLPLAPPPAVADHSYYLRTNLEIGNWRLERGFFNTSTFRPQLKNPTLHRTIDGYSTNNETFTSQSALDGVNSVSYDKKNDFLIQHSGIKVVDLIIQNFDEGNHPMHLHGHKFWVLGQGHGMFPGYQNLGLQPEGRGLLPQTSPHHRSLDNLIRRDVASVEGFGWLVLRFVADNPGIWAFHCHMAWHAEAGMVMQFLSKVDEVREWSIPEQNQELCQSPILELEKGAAPKDDIWFGFGIGG